MRCNWKYTLWFITFTTDAFVFPFGFGGLLIGMQWYAVVLPFSMRLPCRKGHASFLCRSLSSRSHYVISVQGFQWACREGPLCDEPVRNVKFRMLDAGSCVFVLVLVVLLPLTLLLDWIGCCVLVISSES